MSNFWGFFLENYYFAILKMPIFISFSQSLYNYVLVLQLLNSPVFQSPSCIASCKSLQQVKSYLSSPRTWSFPKHLLLFAPVRIRSLSIQTSSLTNIRSLKLLSSSVFRILIPHPFLQLFDVSLSFTALTPHKYSDL